MTKIQFLNLDGLLQISVLSLYVNYNSDNWVWPFVATLIISDNLLSVKKAADQL